jgi:hypothetical protein
MVDIIDLLNENKEWLFSGLGITILGLLVWIIRTVFHRRHEQKATEQKLIQVAGDYGVNTQVGGNVIINHNDFGGKRNVK